MGVNFPPLNSYDVQTDLFFRDAGHLGILVPGGSLYSPAQTFRLIFQQDDGDLELQTLDDSRLPAIHYVTIWSLISNSHESPINVGTPPAFPAQLNMQEDGNLVRKDINDQVHWASYTQGNNRAFLRMQDDGNLVIYTQGGRAIWATNTFAGPGFRPTAGPLH
jgi:hypothetical protein